MTDVALAEVGARREACEREVTEPAETLLATARAGDHEDPRDPVTQASAEVLLERVERFISRFVVLPSSDALTAVALFVAHSHAIEGAHSTPYLAILSAERESGKTLLTEVIALLVRNPLTTVSASEAALFRAIGQEKPTLLLDEIDATFGSATERTEPFRAILNAGNRRGGKVTRCVGQKHELAKFEVFCAKVLAGIDTGRLPETIENRSIVLRMKRRRRDEPIEKFRHRFAQVDAVPIAEQLAEWAEDAVDALGDAEPPVPDELADRGADGWEPLLAIADAGALRDHLDEHLLGLGREDGLVFGVSAVGPFTPVPVIYRADKAWKAAKLERITMHECRHTFASLMIAAGVNAKALSTYMGHANIGITLDRYGHLMPGNEKEAARMLDAYLQRADTSARLAQIGG